MKTLATFFSFILFGAIYIGNPIRADSDTICKSENEKDIYEYLEETEEALINSTQDLSEEQMQYKPDAESWSVAEIVEHINLVENSLKSLISSNMGADASKADAKAAMTDEEVMQLITNRSQKMKTQGQFEPTGEFMTSDEAIKAFIDQREEITDWLKDSNVDMRSIMITEFPFGPVDGYQTLLFLAGHTERHTAQIEEVKASAGFPGE
ncbi:DinB family protein [Christiangramia sp. SM2212]|uniref:DinB family protein n=1 Tax=Christiangramia sediminicola TaxID=3073267 RepID=A0ABU1EPB3_9FLAO|nr:DinB family protein [Christiangramia sp. SM2212]MDR5590227.1 DinB family protein [Christiangramia sp. SM2212]